MNNEIIKAGSHIIAKDFLSQEKCKVELNILSVPFEIDVNPPTVQSVKLADNVLSGYLIYPFKLSLDFANEHESEFNWFVSDVDLDASKVGNIPKTAWRHR